MVPKQCPAANQPAFLTNRDVEGSDVAPFTSLSPLLLSRDVVSRVLLRDKERQGVASAMSSQSQPLASLRKRIRSLGPDVVHISHGPAPFK
jgi:hypothetical protein